MAVTEFVQFSYNTLDACLICVFLFLFRPFEAKRVHKQLFGKFLDVNDLRQNISFAVGLFIIIARMLTVIFC